MTTKHQFGLYLHYSERKNNGNFQKVIYVAKVSTESFFFSKLKKVIETKAFTSNGQRNNSENVLMLGTENGGYIFVLIQRDETQYFMYYFVYEYNFTSFQFA